MEAWSIIRDVLVTLLGVGTLGFLVMVRRVYKLPKRVDRLEAAVPPILRGVWALLKVHVDEQHGDTDPQVTDAYGELTRLVTDGVVSKKEGK